MTQRTTTWLSNEFLGRDPRDWADDLLDSFYAKDVALTLGEDGTGYDVLFYGDTTGAHFHWDASEDLLHLDGTSPKFKIGDFSGSTIGTGSILSASNTASFRVYCDDGGVAIGSGQFVRAGVFRHLITYTGGNREQEAGGVVGQVVSVAGTNRHNMAGTWGSYEARSSLVVDGQAWATDPWIQAAVLGRVGVGDGITTINANGILAGVAAMSNTTSFSANNGTYTGLFVGKWSGTVDWGYGIVIDPAAVSTNAIYMPGGTAIVAVKLGALSSATAGSGFTVSDSVTRVLEVHADDNDTARSVGTQGRAIFGRTMIYANNACEDWGVHGLSKMSAVTKTGNVSAGVVGAWETTGTCQVSTGSGNSFVAGVMGRVGTGGSVTLDSGTYAACVLAFGNNANSNAFTGTGYCGFLATITDVGTAETFDAAIVIDDSCAVTGIQIGTTSGTGIDFPAGKTYDKALAYGTFTTPILFGDDEPFEIHGRLDADTKTKPLMRVRCSTTDGTAMTTGEAHAIQAQAYNTSTSDGAVLEALQAHVGIKANCTIIADIGTMPNMRAGWFKIEDLGFDLALTGDAAAICLGWQFNTGTVLTGNADWIFLAKEGSLTDPADAFIRVYDGAGGGWANYLLDVPASLPYDAANSSGSQSGKIAIRVGNSTKYIQCYSD